jgi:CRISPR type IV-associated protein Csf2
MKTYLFEGVMTCLTSVSHIGDSHGVNSKLRREKVVTREGVEEIPVISGNSLRGILRDRGMLHMLKMLGYGVNEATGEVSGLSLPAFYFLFSGGALTKIAGRGLDIDEARKWRELIPLVALFGGAMGNQIMPGKCKIGKAIPICEETAHLLPERFGNGNQAMSIWEMVQEEAYTRRDDEKNENLRRLIAPDVRGLLEAKAMADRAKTGTKDDVAGETGQKQQMRYFIETLAAGTELFWEITLDDVTSVEFDAFAITLAEFSKFPYIGGKSGVGHGKVSIKFDKWIELNPRLAPAGQEIDLPLGAHYMQHLERKANEIRSLLNGLS